LDFVVNDIGYAAPIFEIFENPLDIIFNDCSVTGSSLQYFVYIHGLALDSKLVLSNFKAETHKFKTLFNINYG
jgi:hypothetical protein